MATAKKAVPKIMKRKLSEVKADYLAAIRTIQECEKQLKTHYPDKDLKTDWKDAIDVDVHYVYVSNEFPSVDRQNEQWVGLQLESSTGVKFCFNFHDLEDVDYLVNNIIDMKDFVEEQNENWSPDEDEDEEVEEEDTTDVDLQQIIDQLQNELNADKKTKKKK